jgi:CopG family nickel-responsive transcriptional regulator
MVSTSATRFSVSLPADLLKQLDQMVSLRKQPSRSRAIAEMIRHGLVERESNGNHGVLAGTITLIYGNRRGVLRNQLAKIQCKYLKEIISSQHVFLEDQHSLEVLLVQGPSRRLNRLADALRGVKGVTQVRLAFTACVLPPLH